MWEVVIVGAGPAGLAAALRAIGDDDDADLELEAARDEFASLGAEPDRGDATGPMADVLFAPLDYAIHARR